MFRRFLVFLAFLFTGCITAAGARVAYVTSDASRFATCERLPQHVTGFSMWNNQDEAVSSARNQAAAKGATHINILAQTRNSVRAEAYRCPTDVGGLR